MHQQSDLEKIFAALQFAAEKHRFQRRKDQNYTPYINHPIEVAGILANVGGVDNTETLMAALLHDTIEDTDTTQDDIRERFGETVLALVMECTDDKSLPKETRKRLQEEHAPHKSPQAKLVKIADKISNVRDLSLSPPSDWSYERREEYLNWSQRVVDGLRGDNSALDALYDQVLAQGRANLAKENAP